MAEINDWSISAASNNSAAPDGWPPSTMTLGTVDNTGRELMAVVKRFVSDSVEGTINSAGGTTVYTVAANRTLSAYYDGMRQGFHVNATNTGAVTLNIDGIGAKAVTKNHDIALAAGDWEQHQYVEVIYSASDDKFQMLTPTAHLFVNPNQSEAETGTATVERVWTAERVKQAILALAGAAAGLASGTVCLFYQDAAPTAWTKNTATLDNHAIRIVTSTAWATGSKGATAFDSVFGSSKNSGNYAVQTADIQSHTHSLNYWIGSGGGSSPSFSGSTGDSQITATGGQGGGGNHQHSLSLDVNYINMIIATKD